jgi:hypothetical protein
MPFKLIAAGSGAAGHRIARGAPGHAEHDKVAATGSPATAHQPDRTSSLTDSGHPQTRKPTSNARPTMINTAARSQPDRTILKVLRDCGGQRLRGVDNSWFTSRRHAKRPVVGRGRIGPTPLTVDDERGEEWTLEAKTPMASGCEMLASSAAPHRIGISRADVRRAHGRSALSDLAHRTQPAVHPRLQCPGAALRLRVRRPRNRSVSTVLAQNVSDDPADLDGDRHDRLSGGCADKAVAAGDPQRRSLAVRAAEPGGSQPLRRRWDTRSATAEDRRPTS